MAGNHKIVCQNRKASYNYELSEHLECGIILTGTEVKSLRAGQCSIDAAWAKIKDKDLWLVDCEIPEYKFGNRLNHEIKRERKLLLHRREFNKFAAKADQQGFTLVPVSVYFDDNGRVKVEVAIGRGKQLHDKRQSIKNKEAERAIRKQR